MSEVEISVIMPLYNNEKYVAKAVESILSQTFANFEFLIIDDGSTDKSIEIIKMYSDPRIKIINQNHLGMVEALNLGLRLAKGRYIARMDSDDWSAPTRFEVQLEQIKKTGAHFCGCHYFIIDENDKYLDCLITSLNQNIIEIILSVTVPFAHGSVLMDRDFLINKQIRYGITPYHAVEDHAMWFVAFENGAKITNCDSFLYKYRSYKESYSNSKINKMRIDGYQISKRILKNNKKNYLNKYSEISKCSLSENEKKILVCSVLLYVLFNKDIRPVIYINKLWRRYLWGGIKFVISNFILKRD